MAGWGVKLLGFGRMLDGLKDVQVKLNDDAVYVVGTNVEYAVYQELGTSKMDAQPYLFPAARAAERNPRAYVRRHTNTSIEAQSSMEDVVKVIALAIERDAAERAPWDTGNLAGSIRSVQVR